jgi:hypothetical protein
MADRQRFEFRFAPRYQRAARPFGVTPRSAWVEVSSQGFEARYGRWRVKTPLTNIKEVSATGPYHFIKTAGPARLAITDRGLTFASNGERGVLIEFHSAVPGLDPLGLIRHPELTVTVADVDGLIGLISAALAEADRPGQAPGGPRTAAGRRVDTGSGPG